MADENSGQSAAIPTLIPQPNGGALLSGGMPGNAGGGRPPKTFAAFMRELRESPKVHEAIQRAAEDETSRGFQPVINKLAEYDPEKPGQKLEVAGAGGGPIQVKIVREGKRPTK